MPEFKFLEVVERGSDVLLVTFIDPTSLSDRGIQFTRTQLLDLAKEDKHLILDFQHITSADAISDIALGRLIHLRDLVTSNHREFVLCHFSRDVLNLMNTNCMIKMFQICPDEATAIEAATNPSSRRIFHQDSAAQ